MRKTYLDVNGYHAATRVGVSVGTGPRRPVGGCQRQHLREAQRIPPAPTRGVHDRIPRAEGACPVGASDARLPLQHPLAVGEDGRRAPRGEGRRRCC